MQIVEVEADPRPKVFFVMPSDGTQRSEVMLAVLQILSQSQARGMRVTLNLRQGKPAEDVRHHAIAEFLKTDCQWYLTLDADNPPVGNPLDLISLDKDIIGLPTPIYKHGLIAEGWLPVTWNVFLKDEERSKPDAPAYRQHPNPNGLQRADVAGQGCMLVARRVFEHPAMRAPFLRKYTPEGFQAFGDDIVFCQRALAAGFEVWAHFDYPCHHYKTVDLLEVMEVMHAQITEADNESGRPGTGSDPGGGPDALRCEGPRLVVDPEHGESAD